MMKNVLLKTSFLFLIFVVGCTGIYPMTGTDIYRGTDGLTLEFIENSPPDEVFEKTIAPLGIILKNEGAYDITDGYITFSLEEDYMLLDTTSTRTSKRGRKDYDERFDWIDERDITWIGMKPQIKFSLKGKTIESPEGDQEIMTLKADVKALEELSQIHESTILATACYDYKTQLAATICVDTDIYNLKGVVKSCEVRDISFSDQGGPVAVTRIETEMMPMDVPNMIRPQFLIYIQNKGEGLVIKKEPEVISDACSEKPLNYSKLGIVFINVYLGGDQKQLSCDVTDNKPDSDEKISIVKLRDDEGIARCVLEEGIDEKEGTYPSILRIELDYGYTHTISTEVIIKKQSKY